MTSSSVGKGIAVSGMFFMLGLCLGNLNSRMTTIEDRLQSSNGMFGNAFLAMSAGVVLSSPVSGWMIAKLGSRNVGLTAIPANAVLLPLVPLASSVYQFVALLLVSGFSYSVVNVSNNIRISLSETLSEKTELPSFHSIWGLTGFIGAGSGASTIRQNFALSTHFGVISVIVFLATLVCWRFLHDQSGTEWVGRAFAMSDRRLFNYGLIVFFSVACEGIVYDWSIVCFQDMVSAERQLVGIGFMVLTGAMTVDQLLLSRVVDRFGTRNTLQQNRGLTLIGMVTMTAYPGLPAPIIGFCSVSLGICTVIPLVAGTAARSSSMVSSSAIAAILTIGSLGTLVGPPLIGFPSEALGLCYVSGACVVLTVGIIPRAGKIPRQAPSAIRSRARPLGEPTAWAARRALCPAGPPAVIVSGRASHDASEGVAEGVI